MQQKPPLFGSFEDTFMCPGKLLSTPLDGVVRRHRDNHAVTALTSRGMRRLPTLPARAALMCVGSLTFLNLAIFFNQRLVKNEAAHNEACLEECPQGIKSMKCVRCLATEA